MANNKKSIESKDLQQKEAAQAQQTEELYQELSIREVEERLAFAGGKRCNGCS